MVTVAFIPVRAGSRSIPNKNIRMLAGRPLVHWVASAALECPGIDRVYVSSDGEEVRRVATLLDHPRLFVIDRSAETASDEASTESAMLEFARRYQDLDRIVLIQATSPLLTAGDLARGLTAHDADGVDSVVSVVRDHRFRWSRRADGTVAPDNYDPMQRPRRQDWSGELFENGAFYVTTRDALMRTGCRISGRTAAVEMDVRSALEIDEPVDWTVAETLLAAGEEVYKAVPGGAASHTSRIATAAARIKLLITDVDGVLTDGGMYYTAEGEAAKRFNTRDGMGAELWRKAGRRLAVMTGEDSPAAIRRAEKLRIDLVFAGVDRKDDCLRTLMAELGLAAEEVAYIGDDLNDLPAIRLVGLSACPADAASEVRSAVDVVLGRRGGEGCLREWVDLLLTYAHEKVRHGEDEVLPDTSDPRGEGMR